MVANFEVPAQSRMLLNLVFHRIIYDDTLDGILGLIHNIHVGQVSFFREFFEILNPFLNFKDLNISAKFIYL